MIQRKAGINASGACCRMPRKRSVDSNTLPENVTCPFHGSFVIDMLVDS